MKCIVCKKEMSEPLTGNPDSDRNLYCDTEYCKDCMAKENAKYDGHDLFSTII